MRGPNIRTIRQFRQVCGFALLFLFAATIAANAALEHCSLCHATICSKHPASVHGRAGLACSSCHDRGLHGKGMTGERCEQTCQGCHEELLASWCSSKHGQAGLCCLECHSIHKPFPGRELAQLKKAEDLLCRSCHPFKEELHSGIVDPTSLERKSCVICHDPHGGDIGLLTGRTGGEKWELNKAYNHRPVAEGRCQDCHSPHLVSFGRRSFTADEPDEFSDEDADVSFSGSKQGLLKKSGNALCNDCHSLQSKNFAQTGHAKVRGIGVSGEQIQCLGCHLPHASEYPALTKLPGDALCVACHSGYTAHHFLSFGSVKQGELECVACHEPHGVGYRRLLRRENICAMCHKK